MSSQTYSKRQPAKKVFAPIFRDANHQFNTSDEENAPEFLLLPTGEAVNRIHICGTLVETGTESDDFAWGTVQGPSGENYSLNAGRFQEKAQQVLRAAEPPVMVAVTGKARVNNNGYSVIQATYISPVSDADYDLWVEHAGQATIDRIESMLADDAIEADRAREVYGSDTGEQYSEILKEYRDLALDALDNTAEEILAATEASD